MTLLCNYTLRKTPYIVAILIKQGWHSRLVHGLGGRGPEFDSRLSHPCFDFFPLRVALNTRKTEHLWRGGSKMSAPSTSGLSVELLLRVIDVKYGYFTLLLSRVNCVSLQLGTPIPYGNNESLSFC